LITVQIALAHVPQIKASAMPHRSKKGAAGNLAATVDLAAAADLAASAKLAATATHQSFFFFAS
jgi:ABC-type arginine transport system permease subunit